jgi:hypothetical protein
MKLHDAVMEPQREPGPLAKKRSSGLELPQLSLTPEFAANARRTTTPRRTTLCSWTGLTSAESRCRPKAGDTGCRHRGTSSKRCGTVGTI